MKEDNLFCSEEYDEIIKNIETKKCASCEIQKFGGLISEKSRAKLLQKNYDDLMTKLYLTFYQAALPFS